MYVRCHGKGGVPVLRVDFALCGDSAAACNPAVAEKNRLHVSWATNCNILALSAGRLLSRVPFKNNPSRRTGISLSPYPACGDILLPSPWLGNAASI